MCMFQTVSLSMQIQYVKPQTITMATRKKIDTSSVELTGDL